MKTEHVYLATVQLSPAHYGLVPLHLLGQRTGLTPRDLHAAVQELRRAGKLSAAAAEGRHGVSPEESRYYLHEENEPHPLGYVMLRQAS
jgi:hypothetical protein